MTVSELDARLRSLGANPTVVEGGDHEVHTLVMDRFPTTCGRIAWGEVPRCLQLSAYGPSEIRRQFLAQILPWLHEAGVRPSDADPLWRMDDSESDDLRITFGDLRMHPDEILERGGGHIYVAPPDGSWILVSELEYALVVGLPPPSMRARPAAPPLTVEALLSQLAGPTEYDMDRCERTLTELAVTHGRVDLRIVPATSETPASATRSGARELQFALGMDGMTSSHPCSDPSLFRHLLARLSVVLRRDGVQRSPYGFVSSFARSGTHYDVVTTNDARDGFSVVMTRRPNGTR